MAVSTLGHGGFARRIARGRIRALAVPLAAVLSVPVVALAVPAVTSSTTASAATPTTALPFDMPSTATLRGAKKLVFTHYWPPLPVSIDNKDPNSDYYARNYLTPSGENGKHAAYGGYLRDRPIPRAPRTGTDWRLQDKKAEVQQAIAAGIDGWTLDILQMPGDPDTAVADSVPAMLQAAQAVDPGFKVMLMPDMSGSLAKKTVDQWAAYLADLAKYPNAYRLSDGRLVVAPFKGEAWSVAKWTQLFDLMKSKYGISVAFVPTFVAHEKNYATTFAPISYAMSIWGSRNPAWTDPTLTYSTGPTGRALTVKSLGQKWMQYVAVQDVRPNQGIFDEAGNTQTLRNTWDLARTTDAEFVQMATWSDYGETTAFAPSTKHGYSWLDISSYYLNWYKFGTAPKVVRDTVYLTHRTQAHATKPSYPQTKLMTLRGGTPARDTVEALTFLTEPGTVKVTVGSTVHTCAAPAGLGVCTVPLGTGTVKASVVRGTATTASVTSPHVVTATPYVQDLQYVAVSSGREGTSSMPAAPVPTPTPTVTPTQTVTPTPTPTVTPTPPPAPAPAPTVTVPPTVVTLTPTADTYGNAGAPSTNYGSTSSLTSRGSLGATSFLKFDLPVAPAGKELVGAELRVRTTGDSFAASTDTISVRLADSAWSESSLNWNNRLDSIWIAGRFASMPSINSVYSAPVSVGYIESVTESGPVTQSFALTSAGTDSAWFWSRNHPAASYRPALVLTYQ